MINKKKALNWLKEEQEKIKDEIELNPKENGKDYVKLNADSELFDCITYVIEHYETN